MRASVLFMLVLLLGAFAPVMSAETFFSGSKWQTFTSSPGSIIERDVYQNRLWVDLDKYDINNVYTGQLNSSSILPAGYLGIRAIVNDNFGNIWISTAKGIARYNEATKVSTHFSTADGLSSDNVGDLFYDKASNRLLTGAREGFNSTVLVAGSPSGWEKMMPTTTNKVIHDIGFWQGEEWAFNTVKIYRRVKGGAWTSYEIGAGGSFIDKDGTVWITVEEGSLSNHYMSLYKFDRASDSFQKVPVTGDALAGACLVIDRDRVMWLSGPQSIVQVDLKVTPLVAKAMDCKAIGNEWLNDEVTLELNPVGGVIASCFSTREDTTGLGEYYKNISSAVRQPLTKSFTIVREKAQFVGLFGANGRVVNANSLSSSVLSSGNYFAVYRTADGQKIVDRYLGLQPILQGNNR